MEAIPIGETTRGALSVAADPNEAVECISSVNLEAGGGERATSRGLRWLCNSTAFAGRRERGAGVRD